MLTEVLKLRYKTKTKIHQQVFYQSLAKYVTESVTHRTIVPPIVVQIVIM